MNVPNIKKDEVMSIIYITGLLIFIFLIYKIFSGVGLIKTGKKKEAEKQQEKAVEELRASEFFTPGLASKVPPAYSLGEFAKTYAQDIRQAVRGFGTNEEKIFTIFGRLKSRFNISEIAFVYRQKYNRDLLTDILNDLTDKEQVTLWNIVNKIGQ